MKNQALTTTLAVLLAVSLSALVALIVSAEVIGGEAIADTPTAIEIAVVTPEDNQQTASNTSNASTTDEVTAPAADNDDGSSDDGSSDDGSSDDGSSDDAVTGDTPATNDEGTTTTDDDPGTGEPPCDGEIIDGECLPPVLILCAPGYTLIDGECLFTGCPKPLFLQDGVCQELDLLAPCDGEIIDGECVPPISILCAPGYQLVDQDCVFVGCPNGYQLVDGVCDQLGLQIPCPEGFHRVGGACLPILVLDPDLDLPTQLEPICFVGQHVENGVCVPDATFNPDFQVPGLELATNG